MIRNQWYVILESRELSQKARRFVRLGEGLVLWRDSLGKAWCLVDRCCHRGAALSAGKLVADPDSGKLVLQCPFHGLEYSGDGRCTCIPANGRKAAVPANFHVPSYRVHEDHGWVWIFWGDREPGEVPAWFEDLEPGMSRHTVRDPWKIHYSRVLENQLDVVHLPFVHHNTIGRGNRTVVDGPGVQWVGERMLYTYVFNRLDDGSPARKPDEVSVPPTDRDFRLEMIMPNLWQNRIAPKLRIVAAFVPVDDGNTLLYLRTYQSFLGIPFLRGLVNRIFSRVNLMVAHQDRRVVQTQVPSAPSLRGGEQLFQGDLPIVEYRRKRQSLLDASGKQG